MSDTWVRAGFYCAAQPGCADEYSADGEGVAGGDTGDQYKRRRAPGGGGVKFVGGLRTKVLAKLAEKIGTAEVAWVG